MGSPMLELLTNIKGQMEDLISLFKAGERGRQEDYNVSLHNLLEKVEEMNQLSERTEGVVLALEGPKKGLDEGEVAEQQVIEPAKIIWSWNIQVLPDPAIDMMTKGELESGPSSSSTPETSSESITELCARVKRNATATLEDVVMVKVEEQNKGSCIIC
ncbi:hypothetical protein Ocin01_12760 [Orchesella cincta]|uniref:Uncharacterized protein n=1 Tax=Orchesella cincta TaxID=48709 RepID=A0A1D2MLM2_ORCCI|nr:hypothetical protein Ocin01_12760 [Orchesella cincta]